MSHRSFAVVVIGRNEGVRLHKCLQSVVSVASLVVYVDSGSSDDSTAFARGLGCEVVELDMRLPFTAARARNEGFQLVRARAPELAYVQFVDGDCEVVADWLSAAATFLDGHLDIAAVCGRRRERYPEHSIYNRLCDIEWATPIGEAKSCGGDVMMRADALAEVGGYLGTLIAGEEPELCVRLRAAGWRVWRMDREMTMHDAAIERFGQWWKRAKRAGYAFAAGAALHGNAPEKHYVGQTRRALLWGVFLPIAISILAFMHPLFLCLASVYPAQIIRLIVRDWGKSEVVWWRAGFLVLSRFPEGIGCLSYLLNRALGKDSVLIEYK